MIERLNDVLKGQKVDLEQHKKDDISKIVIDKDDGHAMTEKQVVAFVKKLKPGDRIDLHGGDQDAYRDFMWEFKNTEVAAVSLCVTLRVPRDDGDDPDQIYSVPVHEIWALRHHAPDPRPEEGYYWCEWPYCTNPACVEMKYTKCAKHYLDDNCDLDLTEDEWEEMKPDLTPKQRVQYCKMRLDLLDDLLRMAKDEEPKEDEPTPAELEQQIIECKATLKQMKEELKRGLR